MFATTNKRLIDEYHRKSWPTCPHFKCQASSLLRCIAAVLQISKLNTIFFESLARAINRIIIAHTNHNHTICGYSRLNLINDIYVIALNLIFDARMKGSGAKHFAHI